MKQALPALVAGALLGWSAWREPGLRHVDFIDFAERARALPVREALAHPLYPAGYPALLAALQPLTQDVLVAGKLLSVVGGVALVAGTARWLGPAASLWVLAQPLVLYWGAVEGTDVPALALCLCALALAGGRAGPPSHAFWAGLAAGGALLLRYQAAAVVPALLLLSASPGRTLLGLLLGLTPHVLAHAVSGQAPWPEVGANLAIGVGQPSPPRLREVALHWPHGFGRAALEALAWPASWLGLPALVLASWRGDRRAWALGAWALCHLAGVGLAFANPRLVLPAVVALALAGALVVPARWLGAGAVVALLAGLARPVADDPEAAPARHLAQTLRASPALGSVYSVSPWFHQHDGGWLRGAAPLGALGPPPWTPDQLRREGVERVALQPARVRWLAPDLQPWLELPADHPAVLLADRRWRIIQVELTPLPGERGSPAQAPAPAGSPAPPPTP